MHQIPYCTLSGRGYEEMLRCCYSQELDRNDKLHKVSALLEKLCLNLRSAYYRQEQLPLDESLLLFRIHLSLRQYIKGKKGMLLNFMCCALLTGMF